MTYAKVDIENYLYEIKEKIKKKQYMISHRGKNEQLKLTYLIDDNKQEEILKDLNVEDFSEAVRNSHPEHSDEILYIFGKYVSLIPRFGGNEKKVELYIKFNKLPDNVIVISFHEAEYPLTRYFKEEKEGD